MKRIDTPEKRELINSYCARFKNVPSKTLGRKLYAEHPELFFTQDSAYQAIRGRRGNHGKNNRKTYKTNLYRPNGKAEFRWRMPDSKVKPWVPFVLETRKNLILSDIHLPYHDSKALAAAIKFGERMKPDAIILNGDTIDFYSISRFMTDPGQRALKAEIDATKQFLGWLRQKFPRTRIIYKLGNHDERWEHFIWTKAAELWDMDEVQFEAVMGFDQLGVEMIKNQRKIEVGKLAILHGHEFPKGLTNSVNPARGNFLRGLECSLAGHLHRTSEHAETSLHGRFITCWSTGCLCGLTPEYARINKWNHGFAFVELAADKQFNVENLRILNGKML